MRNLKICGIMSNSLSILSKKGNNLGSCPEALGAALKHIGQVIIFGLALILMSGAFAANALSRPALPLSAKTLKALKAVIKKDKLALLKARSLCKKAKFVKKLGVCDADKDGFVNRREKALGTNALLKDTDFDGRSDYAEVIRYHTNPLVVDNLDGGCYPLYFDPAGNTSQFGIPAKTIGNLTRGQRSYATVCGMCHKAAEKATNYTFLDLKNRLSQAPMFITSLKDSQLADLAAFLNRSKLGTGACTIDPGVSPTPTPAVTPPGCANQYFDTNGDTTQFEIPVGLMGNMTRGADFFTTNCNFCHSERGTNFTFPQIKTAVIGPLMNIQSVTDQQYADLAAYLNRAMAPQNCGTPTPVPTPTAIPTPTVAPTPTPTLPPLGCSNQYFDSNGDTTQFDIPAPLVGNMGQGSSYYNLGCTTCHTERGTNFTFPQLKAAVIGPKMNIQSVSDQQYANITAYLNRALAPQNCAGTPTPTPTPIDDNTAGQIIFQATCQTCHSPTWDSLRTLSSSKLKTTILDVRQMRSLSLTDEQIRVLLVYLHGL